MNTTAVSIAAGLIVFFIFVAIFIPGDPMVIGFSAAIFVALAVGLGRWGPAVFFFFFPALQRYAGEKPDRETSYGLVGLVLWMLSEEGKRIYSVVNIQLGRPDWFADLYIAAFLNAVTFAGVVLLVLAARFEGEKPTRLPTIVIGLLAFAGVIISYALPTIIAKLILYGSMLARIGGTTIH